MRERSWGEAPRNFQREALVDCAYRIVNKAWDETWVHCEGGNSLGVGLYVEMLVKFQDSRFRNTFG